MHPFVMPYWLWSIILVRTLSMEFCILFTMERDGNPHTPSSGTGVDSLQFGHKTCFFPLQHFSKHSSQKQWEHGKALGFFNLSRQIVHSKRSTLFWWLLAIIVLSNKTFIRICFKYIFVNPFELNAFKLTNTSFSFSPAVEEFTNGNTGQSTTIMCFARNKCC